MGLSTPPDDTTQNDQSNDASFGACSTNVVPWEGVPLYQDGVLVWGEEPYSGGGEGGEGGEGGMGGDTGEAGAPAGGQSG